MTATLESIAEQIKSGDLDAASSALESVPQTDENEADLCFLRGALAEASDDVEAAIEQYLQAVETQPEHRDAAFHAAVLLDRYGDDEEAIRQYEKCLDQMPAPVNLLINVAAMYEERGRLDEAAALLKCVLDAHPNHTRARHYLKSVESSYDMVFDEASQRDREKRSAILDTPIADFELSVRSRNCLRQMNIRTLGDLLKTGEAELLGYKNFGETSLNEIKTLLQQKGLSLGQGVPQEEPELLEPVQVDLPADQAALMRRGVAELELSVRSRKALQRLGITTLGELTQRSEAELMTIKNFGQTSLAEIQRQLETHGLSLRSSS